MDRDVERPIGLYGAGGDVYTGSIQCYTRLVLLNLFQLTPVLTDCQKSLDPDARPDQHLLRNQRLTLVNR